MKTHNKTIKKNQGNELTFKLALCLFTFGSCFYPYVSNAFSWQFFSSQAKEKKNHRE